MDIKQSKVVNANHQHTLSDREYRSQLQSEAWKDKATTGKKVVKKKSLKHMKPTATTIGLKPNQNLLTFSAQ